MRLTFFAILILVNITFAYQSQGTLSFPIDIHSSVSQDSTVKQKAFEVIELKCNVCHLEKRRTNVFTLKNMDSFAQETYNQVFVKERMPKGKDIILTEKERKILMDWLVETGVETK